jgi:lipopolysaccharide export system ATP-binding protein
VKPEELEGPSDEPKYLYLDEPDMAMEEGSSTRPEPPARAEAPPSAEAEDARLSSGEPDFTVQASPLFSGDESPPESVPETADPGAPSYADEPDTAIEGIAPTPLFAPPETRTWIAPPPRPAAEGGNVLEVKGLRKLYGKKVAVATIAFSMTTGEVVGLLGPNGAGKTTVFYMIVGFIRPTAGRVSLDHHDITAKPMYKRARLGIAYLPQEPSVFRRLSVQDNIRAVLETRSDINSKRKRALLDELLEEFGIAGIRAQKAYTLSGGERRRTEIARALALEPKFLLLDEPFAGIDPIAVHEIKSIVRRLSEAGIGVLITDHNVRDTLEITHRAHIINLGRIVVSGDRDEVLASDTARRIYLGEQFRM